MSDHEEWLKTQLNEVVKDMNQSDVECRQHLAGSIPLLLEYNKRLTKGRYDLGIAHLISAIGYAVEQGLVIQPSMRTERTMTDEQLKALAFRLTWADLESFMSQLGIALWVNLWRSHR